MVTDDLRKKVAEAMETLGYQPNFVARSLAKNQSFNVAVTCNDISNPYYGEILTGMKEVAVHHGYMTVLLSPDDFLREGKNFIIHLIQRKVDGVLHMMSHINLSEQDFVQMRENGIALVNDPTNQAGSVVAVDYAPGVSQLASHFIEHGHRNIGVLSWKTPAHFPTDERIRVFQDTTKSYGVVVRPENVFSSQNDFDTSQRDGYVAMKELLASGRKITAVFAMNDLMAYGALRACHEAGLSVPQEISIAGCDDIFLSECTSPPLTTVSVPKRDVGRKSMELLIQRIEKDPAANRTVIFQTGLVKRASVGPAPQ